MNASSVYIYSIFLLGNIQKSILKAIKDFFKNFIVEPLHNSLTSGIDGVIGFLIYSPAPHPPNAFIFGRPTNAFWPAIYDKFWGEMVPIAYLVLFLSYMVSQFGQTWGVISPKKTRGMKKNLLNGLFIIPASWYMAVILLRFNQAITQLLAPNPTAIQQSLDGLLQAGALSGAVVMLFTGASVNLLVILVAIAINLLRVIGIIIIVATLPLLLSFSYGGIPALSTLGQKLYTKLPSLVITTIPTAVGLDLTITLLSIGPTNLGIGGNVGKLVSPMFFLIPGILGIFVPIIMYNVGLYQIGGTAAARAFGTTAGGVASNQSVGQQMKSPVEEAKENVDDAVSKARSAGSSMKETLGNTQERLSSPSANMHDPDRLNESRNTLTAIKNRNSDLEDGMDLPDQKDYFENTQSESQRYQVKSRKPNKETFGFTHSWNRDYNESSSVSDNTQAATSAEDDLKAGDPQERLSPSDIVDDSSAESDDVTLSDAFDHLSDDSGSTTSRSVDAMSGTDTSSGSVGFGGNAGPGNGIELRDTNEGITLRDTDESVEVRDTDNGIELKDTEENITLRDSDEGVELRETDQSIDKQETSANQSIDSSDNVIETGSENLRTDVNPQQEAEPSGDVDENAINSQDADSDRTVEPAQEDVTESDVDNSDSGIGYQDTITGASEEFSDELNSWTPDNSESSSDRE